MDEEKNTSWVLETILTIVIGVCVSTLIYLLGRYANTQYQHKTTYCTEYVKVVDIKPEFEDNGAHEDEQYIVTYEDGVIEGRDQGNIEPFRCTKKVYVPDSERQPGWKEVHGYSGVDWES